MNGAVAWFGHLHPIVVHFPIVLVWIAGVGELCRLRADSEWFGRVVGLSIVAAACFAIVSGASGWILAAHEHIRSDERWMIQWHRWVEIAGTAVLVLAALTVATARSVEAPVRRWARRLLVLLAVVLLSVGTHMGASVVWGPDWLF